MKTNFKTIIYLAVRAIFVTTIYLAVASALSGNMDVYFDNWENFVPQSIGVFTLSFVILFLIHKGSETKKSEDKQEATPAPEPPKPTTYDAAKSIIVCNNKTDKETRFVSKNNFGLKWLFYGNNDDEYMVLKIFQLLDANKDTENFHQLATLKDFSVIDVEWQTFPISEDNFYPGEPIQ